VWELARTAVADHAEHVNSFVLDATQPRTALGFLRYKVFLVYISHVYDNLPTDEVARTRMIPLLPTTVVGSYSVPEWLERLKTDYYRNRISRSHLREIHDMAIKAALKDQEKAGIDIVSDGELRRDNDIDYLLARIPGVQIPVKFSFTGPFSLSHRIQNKAYAKPADLGRALAQVLNAEARALAEAGAELLQIDEPFLAGYRRRWPSRSRRSTS
jgi:methionine synthase II (cobalamin-independent)